MELAGYIASAFIGISLGLVGGGGSILAVPVLVYLFRIEPLLATSYSLFIVGSTSLIGSVNSMRNRLIDLKTSLFFGSGSVVTVFVTRKFLVPLIPQEITLWLGFTIPASFLTMILFAMFMLFASVGMIRDKSAPGLANEYPGYVKILKLTGYGIAMGFITGLLGAGGGFLLIPALVIMADLPMKKAVGTSLAIIAMNSLLGFAGDLNHFDIQWSFLLSITGIASAGIFIGGWLNKWIAGEKLKKGFGWLVLLIGIGIIVQEINRSFLNN